ncbi:MAG TPA: peptide ABC transporter substrate-binding protein [Thermomicrobiales bacterium]|nr:peptide ABC transporter substrate-binding protein [Thermomicrobiales bacterium]
MTRSPHPTGPFRHLVDAFRAGKIDRRSFAQRSAALGVAAPMIAMITHGAGAQDATPAGEESPDSSRSTVGTENQTRGEGGELKLIQWQAPTQLSPHVSNGVKDFLAALPVVEPLMHYTPDSTIIPNLVTDVPTVENGLLSQDLTEVTLTLLPDVVWSDGTPFTAEDVKFTVEWVQNPDNSSVNFTQFEPISSVEVIDELTALVTFSASNPFWMTPFTGTSTGYVYPKHILEGGREAHDAFLSAPVGTGPYLVESFTPNDQVTYVANENYREPNKPFFSRILLKGGGDPASAARSVLQTGEFHYAWYLQAEDSVLRSLESEDGPGMIIPYPGATVERININFSDPHTEVDGQRSHKDTPHPFFTDDAVREAMAVAIDRQIILDSLYGEDMSVATNIVQGDPTVYSPNTDWEYNPEKAAQILEDAGWVAGDDGVREKDGVRLEMTYATETNPLSQKTQAIVKANLEEVGFAVQIEQVDPGVFYDGSAGNDQNLGHFYWDVNMFKSVPSGPRPISFMETWYAGPDGRNIAQRENDWTGQNIQRWQSEEYDALFEAAQKETDPDALADLFIAMNDEIILNHVIITLILVGTPRGMSRQLRHENIQLAPFSYDYWNIANWNFADA